MYLNKSTGTINSFNINQFTVKNFVNKNEFFGTVSQHYEFKKRDTQKLFSVNPNLKEFLNNDCEKPANNFPHLRVESSKIRDATKLNNAFKKEAPVKVTKKNHSDKMIGHVPSQRFHSDKKMNTNLHSLFLGFDNKDNSPKKELINEENKYETIEKNLIVFRRFSLYLSDLLKKHNDKINSNTIKSKCFQDKGNEAKMSVEEFQTMIEANANKVLDSFKKREKYSFKYYRIKEAKVNSFFEEVLDKIYRKIYVMNEQNTILRTDYIVNLIYSEIINMTKEIGDKKDNDGERTSVKNRILFSKTSNLNEIKISENSEGGRKKLSMRFGSLNEENKSRNNYFNRIVKTNDSNTNFIFKSNNPLSNTLDKDSKNKGDTLKNQLTFSHRKSFSGLDIGKNTIKKDSNKIKDLKSSSYNKNGLRDNNALSKLKKSSSTLFSTLQIKSRGKKRKKDKNNSYEEDDANDSKENNIVISNFMPTVNWISSSKTLDTVGRKLLPFSKKNLEEKDSNSFSSSNSKDKNKNDEKEPLYICTELLNSIKENLSKKIEVELTIFGELEKKYIKRKFYRRGGILIIKNDKYNNYEFNDSGYKDDSIKDDKEIEIDKENEITINYANNFKERRNLFDEFRFNQDFELEEFKEDNEWFQQRTKKEERLNAFYMNLHEFRVKSSERRKIIDDIYRVVDNKPKQALNENILFN